MDLHRSKQRKKKINRKGKGKNTVNVNEMGNVKEILWKYSYITQLDKTTSFVLNDFLQT